MHAFISVLTAALVAASPALATGTVLPEPSLAGLFAGGVAATVILARLRRRK